MQVINDYLNGNLSDARRRAKSYSAARLRRSLIEDYGHNANQAQAIAAYLKGPEAQRQELWDAACNMEMYR